MDQSNYIAILAAEAAYLAENLFAYVNKLADRDIFLIAFFFFFFCLVPCFAYTTLSGEAVITSTGKVAAAFQRGWRDRCPWLLS